MPNRKFNARFPPARIKKIMRTDKEVGKVAAPVPVVISRSLELFAEALLQQAGRVTQARGSRTLSPAHLKQCILSVRRFDFLRELVADIPDAVSEEAADPDDGEGSGRRTQNGAGSRASSQRLTATGMPGQLDGDARMDPDNSSGSTSSAAAPTPTPPQQCMSSMADASAILSMHQQLQLQQQQLAASTAAAAASHGALLWHMYQPQPAPLDFSPQLYQPLPVTTSPDAGGTMLAVQYGAVLPEHQQQCSSQPPPPSSHHHQSQY